MRRFNAIADRLLGRLLPKAAADARSCWYPPPYRPNYMCCSYPEAGGIVYCGDPCCV
ncbi:hypothetical protein [Dactylosporangium sp. NPDC048998]|uniref:hypothetical protein n=1 Tax=Dactylosporangium sp. NPDC048998 TaxID=3363976 RepID=UPI0037133528